MSNPKIRSAEALYPILSAFHSVSDLCLRRVLCFNEANCTSAYILDFGVKCLALTACPDDDTIELSEGHGARGVAVDVSGVKPWESRVGQRFGWGWLTTNQQGYIDGAMFSFGGITPNILLTVAASSISVRTLIAENVENQDR